MEVEFRRDNEGDGIQRTVHITSDSGEREIIFTFFNDEFVVDVFNGEDMIVSQTKSYEELMNRETDSHI